MQAFRLNVTVTVNTTETVSTAEIYSAITALLEDFDSGVATVDECEEV